jgi:hypothetical protein
MSIQACPVYTSPLSHGVISTTMDGSILPYQVTVNTAPFSPFSKTFP